VLSEFCFFSRYLHNPSISICNGLTNIGKNKNLTEGREDRDNYIALRWFCERRGVVFD